jgi:hypothetical protein
VWYKDEVQVGENGIELRVKLTKLDASYHEVQRGRLWKLVLAYESGEVVARQSY